MIYTDQVINYSRTDAELEELILFLVLVAGKNASRTAYVLEKFLAGNLHCPFDYIRELIKNNTLVKKLNEYRTGNYTKTEKAFKQLTLEHTGATLRNITPDKLEEIHGIGMKSSRCFVCWSQSDVRYSMLGVHILRWMREELGIETPKQTPSKKKYLELEQIFLAHADKLKINPTELDLSIWVSRRVE